MSGHWSPAADKAASQQARSVRTTGSGFRPSAVVSSGSDALLRTVPVSSTTAALALVAPRSIPTHTGGLERAAGRRAGRVGRRAPSLRVPALEGGVDVGDEHEAARTRANANATAPPRARRPADDEAVEIMCRRLRWLCGGF